MTTTTFRRLDERVAAMADHRMEVVHMGGARRHAFVSEPPAMAHTLAGVAGPLLSYGHPARPDILGDRYFSAH